MDNEELKRILNEKKPEFTSIRHWSDVSNVNLSNIYRLLTEDNPNPTFNVMKNLFDSINMDLIAEDKDIDWGMDMARLRRMPKKLYHGERIEAREHIREDGLHPRVDFFDSIEAVLKFIPTPCDVYEIYPHRLPRRYFDVVDHPFGVMYSYNEHVPKEFIMNRITYR